MHHPSLRILHRPLLPVPGFLTRAATRLLLGEMAEALLLQGVGFGPAAMSAREALEIATNPDGPSHGHLGVDVRREHAHHRLAGAGLGRLLRPEPHAGQQIG